MWAQSSAVLPNAALSSAATVASSAPAKAGAESDGGVAAAKSWTRRANATTNAVTGERRQPLPVERRLLAFRPRLFMTDILCRGAAQRQDRGARDEREDRRKGRKLRVWRSNRRPLAPPCVGCLRRRSVAQGPRRRRSADHPDLAPESRRHADRSDRGLHSHSVSWRTHSAWAAHSFFARAPGGWPRDRAGNGAPR